MQTITVKTSKKRQILDLTDVINNYIRQKALNEGICYLVVQHTTACITTADLDPGTDLDFLDAIEAIAPKLTYRHPHNPKHANDHIMSSLIGPSLALIINAGELVLGTWQRVVLVELDGPRERDIAISVT